MKRTAMQHTKMKRLVRVLAIPQYAAVGILESLWHLTAREALMGNIGKLSNEDIASWIDWQGDADALVAGLVSAGWVDEDDKERLVVHDWFEHADDTTKKAITRHLQAAGENGGNVQTKPDKVPLPEPLPKPEPKPSAKQVPSRDKRESDPRHEGFKAAVMAYGAFKRVKLPWNGSEAKQLASLLDSAPDLTLKEFQTCLNNRARSPSTPHGERPRLWLPNVLRYQQGPLNEFNRTGETNAKPSRSDQIRDSSIEALAILGRMADGANCVGATCESGRPERRLLEGVHSPPMATHT